MPAFAGAWNSLMMTLLDRADTARAPVRTGRALSLTSMRSDASAVFGMLRRLRFLAPLLILLAALVVSVAAAGPLAAQAPVAADQQAVRDKLEGQRAIVDGVEGGLQRESLRSADLDELRSRLDPVRTDLDAAIALLDPRLADLQHRIKEIGPKPAADAPPEEASVTQERDQLNTRASELDGLVKQAKLLKVRTDQISDRITSKRRELFTNTLFARAYSVLDPELWLSAVAAIPVELRGINYLLGDWYAYASARMALPGQLAVAFGMLAVIVLVMALKRMLLRPVQRLEQQPEDAPVSRLRAAWLSMLVALVGSAAAPAATFAAITLTSAFDLIPPRIDEIGQGLLIAVAVISVGRALPLGALAPDMPRRRVVTLSGLSAGTESVPLSDETARVLYRHIVAAAWVLAVTAMLQTVHRALVVPVQLTVATSAMMSILLVLITIRAIRVLGAGADEEDNKDGKPATDGGDSVAQAGVPWLRFPMWLVVAATVASLVAGYVSFASFLVSRSLTAVVMAGALYLIVALNNAFFIDHVASGPRARHMAKALGVGSGTLELLAVLVAGLLKVLAVILTLFLVVGTWGTSTADLRDLVSRITFGFTIGNSTITLGGIASAVVFLIIGFVIARAIQRWVGASILPRTRLDPSLQNSISTIIGYVGAIAVIAVAMGQIGLNLENVALVAGALSVGIGFGLQSIVSNFVSGLILLAERPIRVGDMILVKGEEGYVRRISVRATEIETFDRAMVLIPNSDLITGMVKNFTHANTTGRVIVNVNVHYDVDPEQVRDLLVDCACDHPQVLRSPPPRVFLMKFGDAALQFELRCVVANVDYALTVKSDLHFAVFDRLKAANIGIPFTPWAIYRGQHADPAPPAGEPA
jgi:small-conductance mechanosensitive channel